MTLNSLITKFGDLRDSKSTADILQQHLEPFPIDVQLDQLISLFHLSTDKDQYVSELITVAWQYLLDNQVWSVRYSSLQALQVAVDFQRSVKPFLDRNKGFSTRVFSASSSIYKNWHVLPQQAFPKDMTPPRISDRLARDLKRLSQVCPLPDAIVLLRQQIAARQARYQSIKAAYIQPIDVRSVYENLVIDEAASEADSVAENEQERMDIEEKEGDIDRECKCPKDVVLNLKRAKGRSKEWGSAFYIHVMNNGLDALCYSHLRVFATVTCQLFNNKPRREIEERLRTISSSSIESNRAINPEWFRKTSRVTDSPAICGYMPSPFEFDPKAVFERFAGQGSWNTWLSDGAIVLPNVFVYLNREDVRSAIDLEFDMYEYHYRLISGRPQMDFLGSMFYSLIQQLARQDLEWYALMAAARPDQCWRLISYPSAAKYIDVGDSTGKEYIAKGASGNRLTSSLSLDDEDEKPCSIAVPRKRRIQEETAGATMDCNHREDKMTWSHHPPALSLRLTRSEIMHAEEETHHRVIYTWLTRVEDDNMTLENQDSLNWEEISACHRDMKAPIRGVNGDDSLAPFQFPAYVQLESSCALSDALIGRRKWNDPEVLFERNIVFGNDDERARRFVKEIREKVVRKYLKGFEKLKMIEKWMFEKNSFFGK